MTILAKWWCSVLLFIIYVTTMYLSIPFIFEDLYERQCDAIIERKGKCFSLASVYTGFSIIFLFMYLFASTHNVIINGGYLLITTKFTTELFNTIYFLHYDAPDRCSEFEQRSWIWCDSVLMLVALYLCNELNKLRR